MENLVLNPDYKLFNDNGRVMLISASKYFPPLWGGQASFEHYIHPIYAVILSFFNNTELQKGINDASEYLKVDKCLIENFLRRVISNKNTVLIKYHDAKMFFPPNLLVEYDTSMNIRNMSHLDFNLDIPVDLRHKRHSQPRDISLYITDRCYTDCIYCLADRRKRSNSTILTPARVCELIDEAYRLNINSFEVTGGELFLYPQWDMVVKKLIACGFPQYISTKVPIGENIVKKLHLLGIKEIQVSIDSLIPDTLLAIVNPQNSQYYLGQIKNSIRVLENKGIKVCIHTIITSFNDSVADMESIYNFIKCLSNISSWRIDEAFFSRYSRGDWRNIKTSYEKMQGILNYTKTIKDIKIDIDDEYDYEKYRFSTKEEFLRKGVRCPANYSSIGILSDGKVTTCSRFFWEPQFIIGDVTKNGILDVWNSEKALSLWNRKRELKKERLGLPDGSKCYSCAELDRCIDASRVCWSEIVDINGFDRWDYPDLQCPDSDDTQNKQFILSQR